MAKYRLKEDIPPGGKKGDIVEINDPLVPGIAQRVEAVGDDEEVTAGQEPAELFTGLSRDELKKKADELGVDYPGNISTAKLLEAVQKKAAESPADADDGKIDGNSNPDD